MKKTISLILMSLLLVSSAFAISKGQAFGICEETSEQLIAQYFFPDEAM